jgi:exodeoxyribonuclease VII large subunit
MHRAIARRGQRVDDLDFRLRQFQRGLLEKQAKRLAGLNGRLQGSDLRLRFATNRHRRELLRERLLKSIENRLWQARRRHESLELHLRQLSPLAVLERGYSIVENAAGQVLRSSAEATRNEQLKIRLHRGEIDATVITTRNLY